MRNLACFCVLALLFAPYTIGLTQGDGTLTVMMTPIEGTLDPAFSSNDPDTAFARTLFDYFLEPLPDGTVGPNLAESWEISDNGLIYTFDMVDNATFHDGTPVTSADVVWTFDRLRDPAVGSPASNLLTNIAAISAPDETTVAFQLSEPNAEFLLNLASRWGLVVKAGTTDFSAGNISNVGSGPFVLASYLPGFDAVFERYEGYWREGEPALDTLIFSYENSAVAQVEAVADGAADFIFKLPIELTSEIEALDGVTLLRQPTNQHPVIRLRTDVGPGQSEAVREAFKLATDRERINRLVLGGFGVLGNNDPIGPVFDAYPGNIEDTYNPSVACDLLTEAGYGSPAVLEMTLFAPDALNYPNLADLLQQMWVDGCIYVDVVVQPESTYYSQTWLEVELGITGWGDRPSPQQLLEEAYISSGQFNETRWDNPALDRLIAEARQTPPQERQPIYAEISQLFAEEGPIIVPYFAPMLGAIADDVEGLEMAGFPGLTDYRKVTVQN
ncbi:MAG: ABC transporter substrate-binding protein [Chloroflexota bacterium]